MDKDFIQEVLLGLSLSVSEYNCACNSSNSFTIFKVECRDKDVVLYGPRKNDSGYTLSYCQIEDLISYGEVEDEWYGFMTRYSLFTSSLRHLEHEEKRLRDDILHMTESLGKISKVKKHLPSALQKLQEYRDSL